MNGRLEHELKIDKYIEDKLKDQPVYLTEWHTNLKASKKTAATRKDFVNKLIRFLNTVKDVNNIQMNEVETYFISCQTTEDKDGNIVYTSDSHQQLYLESDDVSVPGASGNVCRTVVSVGRSFEAASSYARAGKKVCVLNFASASDPGGGVTYGSSAQEESLCRCSTLYPCLNEDEMWEKFYLPHRNNNKSDSLHNDDCIYTPEVVVIKSDISFPERLPESEWYRVDVLTCAAPNLRDNPGNILKPFAGDNPSDASYIEDSDLYKLHMKRIERIFAVAAANGAEVLILGAFGCGAFCNPPEVVAKAFYEVQKKYENYFETIEYAIFCTDREKQNYDIFCKQFGSNPYEFA